MAKALIIDINVKGFEDPLTARLRLEGFEDPLTALGKLHVFEVPVFMEVASHGTKDRLAVSTQPAK